MTNRFVLPNTGRPTDFKCLALELSVRIQLASSIINKRKQGIAFCSEGTMARVRVGGGR